MTGGGSPGRSRCPRLAPLASGAAACEPPQARHADGVFAPHDTPVAAVVPVVGARWTSAPRLEAAQGDVGVEHDEVRSWTGGYRHRTLAMWALARLTIWRAGAIAVEP